METRALYSWIHQSDGRYTVKSGYQIWVNEVLHREDMNKVINPNLKELFEGLWNTHTSPKIKHLLWRLLSNNLATAENLKRKSLSRQAECPRCGYESEDRNHIFFSCPFARAVWASSDAWYLFTPVAGESIYANLYACLQEAEKRVNIYFWPWILWRLWKMRNEFIFEGLDYNPLDASSKAIEDANDWKRAQEEKESSNLVPLTVSARQESALPHSNASARINRWQPPEGGMFSCNIDGSWLRGSLVAGIGWIIRNSDGQVRLYGAKTFPQLPSPIHTEAAALGWAMRCLSNMGYSNVCFQLDCSNLVLAVKNSEEWPALDAYLSDICSLLSQNPSFSLKLIRREANQAADEIAKMARNCSLYFATIDNVLPSWLRSIVIGDNSVSM